MCVRLLRSAVARIAAFILMSLVVPWGLDEAQINTLSQQLRQSEVGCSAHADQTDKKNGDAAQSMNAREDVELHARYEELRANDLETKTMKVRRCSGPSHSNDKLIPQSRPSSESEQPPEVPSVSLITRRRMCRQLPNLLAVQNLVNSTCIPIGSP